jgi:formylmethanofuran dehydrogenase subunit E
MTAVNVTVDGPLAENRELVDEVMAFHGHLCPGASLGFRVGEVVLQRLGRHSKQNQLVGVVETNLCAVDPIQYLTGCTFGKRNLIHRDHGKSIFAFWRRSDGSGIRIVANPEGVGARNPELWEIHERIHAKTATPEEIEHFETTQAERQRRILVADVHELFRIEELAEQPPPAPAPRAPVFCARCGEPTLGSHVRQVGDEQLCQPCSEAIAAAT